jgi:hypothetical protein
MTQRPTRHGDAEPATVVGRDDHELLTFAISWLPYGCGPDEEILVRFGLSRARYLARLADTVTRRRAIIHPHTAERLIALCAAARNGQSAT